LAGSTALRLKRVQQHPGFASVVTKQDRCRFNLPFCRTIVMAFAHFIFSEQPMCKEMNTCPKPSTVPVRFAGVRRSRE
jgi:hypothetical protein